MAEPTRDQDTEVELVLARLLSGGVVVSAGILIAGMLGMVLLGHTGYPASVADLGRVHPEAYPHALPSLIEGIRTGRPLALVALGLLVLVLTPVLRVAVSVALFLKQRDYLYAGICAFALGMLLTGMLIGAE